MDKPKCRVCGAKHWSNEPHRFAGEKVEPKGRASSAEGASAAGKSAEVRSGSSGRSDTVSSGSERVRRWRSKNREHYNAYMRDWRKRQKGDSRG